MGELERAIQAANDWKLKETRGRMMANLLGGPPDEVLEVHELASPITPSGSDSPRGSFPGVDGVGKSDSRLLADG